MVRPAILVLLLTAITAGCRGPDPSVELLEGELRWMEDQVYMLEGELQRKCDELSTCRRNNVVTLAPDHSKTQPSRVRPPVVEKLPNPEEPTPKPAPRTRPRVQGGTGPGASGTNNGKTSPPMTTPPSNDSEEKSPPPTNNPPESDNGGDTQPSVPSDNGAAQDELPDVLEPPTIVIPDQGGFESDTDTLSPPTEGSRTSSPPVLEEVLPSPDAGSADEIEGQSYFEQVANDGTAEAVDADISHIVVTARIPRTASGDVPRDRWIVSEEAAEDDASRPMLEVVVEPRNADGKYVALPGPISVVLLDASQSGDAARVGRWDFDAAHCRRALRRSRQGRGIQLNVPWAEIARRPEDLHLFVRYTAVDGRELEDELILGEESEQYEDGQWTPSQRSSALHRPVNGPIPAWSPNR